MFSTEAPNQLVYPLRFYHSGSRWEMITCQQRCSKKALFRILANILGSMPIIPCALTQPPPPDTHTQFIWHHIDLSQLFFPFLLCFTNCLETESQPISHITRLHTHTHTTWTLRWGYFTCNEMCSLTHLQPCSHCVKTCESKTFFLRQRSKNTHVCKVTASRTTWRNIAPVIGWKRKCGFPSTSSSLKTLCYNSIYQSLKTWKREIRKDTHSLAFRWGKARGL